MVLTRKRARLEREVQEEDGRVAVVKEQPSRGATKRGRGGQQEAFSPPSVNPVDADSADGDDDDEDDDEDDEDEDAEEEVISEVYEGDKDQSGRPHGSGRVILTFRRGRHRGQNIFTGTFSHGNKSGPGEWRFDVNTDQQSTLSGPFVNDALEGEGKYVSPDGSYTIGPYIAGTLEGQVQEFSPSNVLLFSGQYRDSQRNGEGTLYSQYGGTYTGQWKDGLFHGDTNLYHYPVISSSSHFSFRGQWREGRMTSCHLFINDELASPLIYTHDESTLDSPIATHPLLPDPYESHCCYVAPSTLPSANEGLFARIDLPPHTAVSFYNGTKQLDTTTESHPWSLNSNTIALDEASGVDIDVPVPFDRLSEYCASVGHKANHGWVEEERNAEYGKFEHPRFGLIKCVRVKAGKGVKAGEELLVDYGFDKRGGPKWWRDGKKKLKAAQQKMMKHQAQQ